MVRTNIVVGTQREDNLRMDVVRLETVVHIVIHSPKSGGKGVLRREDLLISI